MPSYFNMLTNSKIRGLEFVDFKRDILKNLFYPGIYLFGFYFFLRRLIMIAKKLFLMIINLIKLKLKCIVEIVRKN